MLKNYIKITLRNLQKQKIFASINIVGLSIGIACFSLLLLFVLNEFNFDKFHKNASVIFRPYVTNNTLGGSPDFDNTDYLSYSGSKPTPLGESMKKYLPDVVNYTRLQLPWGENLIRVGNNVHRTEVSYADPSFFSVFTFPLKYGTANDALHNLNDVVLTESIAKQFFGTDEVVGKTIEVSIGGNFQPFKISAIAKDIPDNSSVRFAVMGNFQFALNNNNNFYVGSNWHPIARETFIQLRPDSKLSNDVKRLSAFMHAYTPDFITDMKNFGATWKQGEEPLLLKLQPLLSIHTDTWFNSWGFTDYARIAPETLWILLAIAGSILLIACINFTTLAIGRSAGRSKEVGVRKVIGAEKKQIIFQFMTEALLMSFASAILALVLINFLLPWFNQLSGRNMRFSAIVIPQNILLLLLILLITGFLAGSYPSLILSNFKPVDVLKNKIKIGGSNLFTKSLVTFQFALSIILIVSTTVILQQTKFLLNKNPGFNKENVIAIDASETDPNKIFPLFKQELLNKSSIVGVASAAAGLGAGHDFLGYSDKGISAELNIVDTDYIKILGMQLIAGKNLTPALLNDSIKPIVINETMMHAFGWNSQNVVGQQIKNFQGRTAVITGVVKNFNFRPLGEGIKNQAFITSADKGYNNFYVRIHAGNPSQAIAAMQQAWNNAVPGTPLKYSFVDEDVSNYYNAEQRWSGIVGWAGGISIFLACLGLLGLAALAAVNRTKEIGVRKILGASVQDIITLISKDFVKLIGIAFLIASPVAWYVMNKWLQDYANRINISWTVFLFAGLFVIAFALVTISFQAIKAALANPVKSLRSE
jgi:putative ABC transport system permease protein